jgi:UDP-N-acetylglucosamine/UDP-N-acetylgalactosamine diphosphorylase
LGGTTSASARDGASLRAQFEEHGQAHVFRFWDRLEPAEREALLGQCASLDLPRLIEALAAVTAPSGAPPKLTPLEVERLPERGGDAGRRRAAQATGEALLRAGRVGILVVAGGQATRLGFQGPKGLYPIGPVTERTLFEIQAQKIRRLRRASGAALPWYVMTSPATDAATRRHFAEHRHLGLPAEDVFFFQQGSVPSFDLEGRLLLAEPGRLAENPDGHGGALLALLASGALDDMQRRGIDTLFYYQVDNPLVRIADPVFLGLHADSGAEVSCKVVRKLDPMEKVGVLARRDGRVAVVEYTELDDEHRFARGEDGDLRFWAGNIAIHVFATSFVRRVAADPDRWLPFHVSEKAIPCVDDAGRPVQPTAPNGRKLERFVFDALPAALGVCVVEADRAQEFSPVKNARGPDSPQTARRDLTAQYAAWLAAAGIRVPSGTALEIDHSRIDSAEDARAAGVGNPAEAGDLLRMGSGREA